MWIFFDEEWITDHSNHRELRTRFLQGTESVSFVLHAFKNWCKGISFLKKKEKKQMKKKKTQDGLNRCMEIMLEANSSPKNSEI